jgi:hypothetical protein
MVYVRVEEEENMGADELIIKSLTEQRDVFKSMLIEYGERIKQLEQKLIELQAIVNELNISQSDVGGEIL